MSLPLEYIPKYIRCKIKNIAVVNKNKIKSTFETYLEFRNILPNNCICLNSAMGWCHGSCEDAVCMECKHE